MKCDTVCIAGESAALATVLQRLKPRKKIMNSSERVNSSLMAQMKLFSAIHGVYDRNEKAFRETQTLRAGCNQAESEIFAPPQNPFPEAPVSQNLISWRWSLPLPAEPVC